MKRLSSSEIDTAQVKDPTPQEATSLLKQRLKLDENTPHEILTKFEQIFDKLPEFAEWLLNRYRIFLNNRGYHPGKLWLYAVGGRVKGSPLKTASDLDLVIVAESPEGTLYVPPLHFETPRIGQLRDDFVELIDSWADREDLPTSWYEIIEWGRPIPSNGDLDPCLLLSHNDRPDIMSINPYVFSGRKYCA